MFWRSFFSQFLLYNKRIDVFKTSFSTTKVTEEKRTEKASMTECFIAATTFAQERFCEFFKAQLWKYVHNMINSTERSDILVFNCYLCHVRFRLLVMFAAPRIGEISDIFKCFENFVSQALGVLTRVYAAELR